MPVPGQAPRLSGTFQAPHNDREVLGPQELVSHDLANLHAEGDWRPEELRTVQHPLGSAVVYGDCLATDQELGQALDRALTNHDPTALTQLPGSYTTLLFHPKEGLTVLGDLAGQYPFFYRKDEQGGVAFGSITEPLRQAMGSANPDGLSAAARIAIPQPTEIIAGRSATAGLARLEAGHTLHVDRGGNLRTAPYETFQTPSGNSIDAAAEALRQAMLEAAERRAALGRKLSADFSGGLDSTTAAYLLAQAGVPEPLLVATGYTPEMPGEDLDRARRYLALPESQGLFNPQEFAFPAGQEYAGLLEAPASDEPDLNALSHTKQRTYSELLRSHGSELHITGGGADQILDAEPRFYLAGLARAGKYKQLMRATKEAARTGLASQLDVLKTARLTGHLNPATNLRMISRILRGDRTPRVLEYGGLIFGSEAAPQWLTSQARRELSDLALSRADEVAGLANVDAGNYHAYAGIRDASLSQHGAMQFAAGLGLRKRALYMDNPILRACLSIPTHLRVNPWAFKAILAKAMEGLVPPEVTSRSTKGDYTREAMMSLRAVYNAVEQLLRDSRLADLGVIEPKAVKKTLDSVAAGALAPGLALDQFLATELWLRQQEGNSSPASPGAAPIVRQPSPAETAPTMAEDARYGMPKGVFITTRPNGAVALTVQSGTYHRLNLDALRVMQALQSGGGLKTALSLLEAQYPGVDKSAIKDGASRVIRDLAARGILSEDSQTFSIVEGMQTAGALPATMTRQEQSQPIARLRDYPAALGGLLMTLVLKRLPFARQTAFIDSLRKRWGSRPLTEARAMHLLGAVERLSEWHLGRAACLEISMATVLAAALQRRRVDLVLGTKTDPDSFHAWPQVGDTPIRTPRDLPVTGIFEPIFKV